MPVAPRLLIERALAAGAHASDATLRATVLRGLGSGPLELVDPGADDRATAARLAAAPAAAWFAGPHAACAALAGALPAAAARAWWPTVVAGSGAEPVAGGALPLVAPVADAATAALELAVIEPPLARAPAPLWDGAFVLAPAPLDGAEGARLLAAFAAIAEARPELEFVVLADPTPELTATARSLGIGWRVHAAGFAPRDAERTWLASATAVVLPTARPLAAAVVLRALAAGRPLVVDTAAPGAAPLTAWLAGHGLAPREPFTALAAAAAGDAASRAASARGRVVAAAHVPDALAARLAAAAEPRLRRAA